jgi:hypothetical protein
MLSIPEEDYYKLFCDSPVVFVVLSSLAAKYTVCAACAECTQSQDCV